MRRDRCSLGRAATRAAGCAQPCGQSKRVPISLILPPPDFRGPGRMGGWGGAKWCCRSRQGEFDSSIAAKRYSGRRERERQHTCCPCAMNRIRPADTKTCSPRGVTAAPPSLRSASRGGTALAPRRGGSQAAEALGRRAREKAGVRRAQRLHGRLHPPAARPPRHLRHDPPPRAPASVPPCSNLRPALWQSPYDGSRGCRRKDEGVTEKTASDHDAKGWWQPRSRMWAPGGPCGSGPRAAPPLQRRSQALLSPASGTLPVIANL